MRRRRCATGIDERTRGTHPLWRDSDADGYSDGDEVDDGTDPLREEDSVILENGIVVDSIYITGRLRSIATLATVEQVPDLACE